MNVFLSLWSAVKDKVPLL